MTDVVYTLGKGSRWNNNEIRFSLRSIEKYLKGVRNIWIIGELPDFLQNVNHIPATDGHAVPDTNIMFKLKLACEHPEISDPFLFFNDDHYLLAPYTAGTFPFFYQDTLEDYTKRRRGDGYAYRSVNTMRLLQRLGLPTKYFDIHYPILYHKAAFIEHVVGKVDINKPHGFILKSIYANSLKIEGVWARDHKTERPPPSSAVCFTTQPRVRDVVQRYLNARFHEPSKYEK